MKYTDYRKYLERTVAEELGIEETPKESKFVWLGVGLFGVMFIGWIVLRMFV